MRAGAFREREEGWKMMEKRDFDLLSLGEIMLRLSPPDNERITRGRGLASRREARS